MCVCTCAGIKWRGLDYSCHSFEEIRDLQKQRTEYLPILHDYFTLENRLLYPEIHAQYMGTKAAVTAAASSSAGAGGTGTAPHAEDMTKFAQFLSDFRLKLSTLSSTYSFGKCNYLHR